jgi:hypothetical protein
MSLKKKSSIHQYEGEYASPDGEIYDCTVVQHGDRCYIRWQRQGEESNPITIDGAMLEGLYEWYLDLTGKPLKKEQKFKGLKRPTVIDHRNRGAVVESSSSLWDGKAGTFAARTGISAEDATAEPPETPEQWRLDDGNAPSWKQQAQDRKLKPKPIYKAKGALGEKFRRVGASDII